LKRDEENIHDLRGEITKNIAAMLEWQLAINEAVLAQTSAPGDLDAWALFHLGLQRMFRFTASDNAAAAEHFASAVERERGFARAHAGLSFTQFQNAYLGYVADRTASAEAARRHAEQAVALDSFDRSRALRSVDRSG
jgi:hypothetical protein